jgi:hypothetical protein
LPADLRRESKPAAQRTIRVLFVRLRQRDYPPDGPAEIPGFTGIDLIEKIEVLCIDPPREK